MKRHRWRRRFFLIAAIACLVNMCVAFLAAYWSAKAENWAYAIVLAVIALAQIGLAAMCADRANIEKRILAELAARQTSAG